MTVAPIRPDIEAPGVIEGTVERRSWTFGQVLLTVLAGLLFAIGWLVGLVSIPLSWALRAAAVGWDSARRLGEL